MYERILRIDSRFFIFLELEEPVDELTLSVLTLKDGLQEPRFLGVCKDI